CVDLAALCTKSPGGLQKAADILAQSLWEPAVTPIPTLTASITRTALPPQPPTPIPTATAVPTLPSPRGVRAVRADGLVTLSWDEVRGAASCNAYVGTVSGVTQSRFETLPGGRRGIGISSPFVDSGLSNGTTDHFVGTVVNDAGESPAS